ILDPPLMKGKEVLALHAAKILRIKALDQMSPDGLSKRRRDHWISREQADELLHAKCIYRDFDAYCFQAYIDHGLSTDPVRGGVELTIPKMDEVEIFRTNPSLWWLPQSKPQVPGKVLVAEKGPFLERRFPQQIEKKFGIPFEIFPGGHMFPL